MRAFLALEVPGDIVAYLTGVIERLAKRTEGVRWVRREGIHITVKFLGEIEEAASDRMRDALSSMGERFEPVAARLGGLDAFPSRRSARVIVVKLKEGAYEMQAIFSEMEDRLASMNVEIINGCAQGHHFLMRAIIQRFFEKSNIEGCCRIKLGLGECVVIGNR